MNVKVFLHQNQKSTLDIQSSLNYHEEKERNGIIIEDVYKGKIIWSITEKGENGKVGYVTGRKKYLKAIMDKAAAKLLAQSIMNDSFVNRFGDDGIIFYGGQEKKTHETIHKEVHVKSISGQGKEKISYYVVSIFEIKNESSSVPGSKEQDKFVVQSWLSYEEALKLALELYHFIQAEEIKYTLQGKPLYTIMYGREGKPLEVADVQKVSDNQKREVSDDEYIIPLKGPFHGKSLTELTDKELATIMNKSQASDNEIIQKLYKLAAIEAKKRLGTAL